MKLSLHLLAMVEPEPMFLIAEVEPIYLKENLLTLRDEVLVLFRLKRAEDGFILSEGLAIWDAD